MAIHKYSKLKSPITVTKEMQQDLKPAAEAIADVLLDDHHPFTKKVAQRYMNLHPDLRAERLLQPDPNINPSMGLTEHRTVPPLLFTALCYSKGRAAILSLFNALSATTPPSWDSKHLIDVKIAGKPSVFFQDPQTFMDLQSGLHLLMSGIKDEDLTGLRPPSIKPALPRSEFQVPTAPPVNVAGLAIDPSTATSKEAASPSLTVHSPPNLAITEGAGGVAAPPMVSPLPLKRSPILQSVPEVSPPDAVVSNGNPAMVSVAPTPEGPTAVANRSAEQMPQAASSQPPTAPSIQPTIVAVERAKSDEVHLTTKSKVAVLYDDIKIVGINVSWPGGACDLSEKAALMLRLLRDRRGGEVTPNDFRIAGIENAKKLKSKQLEHVLKSHRFPFTIYPGKVLSGSYCLRPGTDA